MQIRTRIVLYSYRLMISKSGANTHQVFHTEGRRGKGDQRLEAYSPHQRENLHLEYHCNKDNACVPESLISRQEIGRHARIPG